MQLSASILTDARVFRDMKAEWNALLEESEANNVFLTWEWMHTWWEIYGQNSELHVIQLRNPLGQLVGIAPFKLSEQSILGIGKTRTLEFIGWGGDVTTEHLDIIAGKGWEKDVYDCVAECISGYNGFAKVDLRHLSSTSPFLPVFKRSLEKRHLPYRIQRYSVCPVVALPGSWEEFFSGKSFNFRKKSKEYLRTSLRDLGIRLVRCDSYATLQQDMAELTKLHLKRWGKKSRAFRTKQYVGFHQKASSLFLEKGWLRLFFLKQGDKALAGIYCFHYNNTYYYYQSGRDTEHAKYSLGFVLLNELMKVAIKERADEFDLLTGEEAYKYRWTHRMKETVRLSCWNNGYGRAAKYFSRIEDMIKVAGKRVGN